MKAVAALFVVVQVLLGTELALAQGAAPMPSLDAPPPPPEPPPFVPPRASVAADEEEVRPHRSRAGRSGVLVLPSLGLHSFQSGSARNYDPGLRLGLLMGWRINELFSANGEGALDVTNPGNVPSGTSVSELQVQGAFSPLLHLTSGRFELVVGPKLGRFYIGTDVSSMGQRSTASISGWLYGINLGLFRALNDFISVGARVSFDLEDATKSCVGGPNFSTSCRSVNSSSALKVLGVGVALLM